MKTVLFVCHANTCRSVMAQALLEQMLQARDAATTVRVRSGGVAGYARDGMVASLDARLVLREVGIHVTEDTFRSTDLRAHRELVADADLILMGKHTPPHVQVKSAGGIRDLDALLRVRALGVTRSGATRTAQMLDECRSRLGLAPVERSSVGATPAGY